MHRLRGAGDCGTGEYRYLDESRMSFGRPVLERQAKP